MEFNNIVSDLKGWKKQLEERATNLKKDQEAYNKLQVLIGETVRSHTQDVVVPIKAATTASVPEDCGIGPYEWGDGKYSAKNIRGMVHKVLTSKKQVPMKEVVSKVCTLASVERDSAEGAKVAQRTYSALSALKDRKLIKGGRKGLSLTAHGRPLSKHWA